MLVFVAFLTALAARATALLRGLAALAARAAALLRGLTARAARAAAVGRGAGRKPEDYGCRSTSEDYRADLFHGPMIERKGRVASVEFAPKWVKSFGSVNLSRIMDG